MSLGINPPFHISVIKYLTIGYLEEGGLSWLTVFRGTVYCVRNRVTSRYLHGIGS